ncbi:hypothetical protein LSAT2_017654 [Lamellibrachia satsuma]|nr:hypothetical protein LSAT2_017654 [Lamellibrachia satsuma]
MNSYPSVYYRSNNSDLYTTALVILYLALFIYLAQAIVSIWLSAIGCSVSCCGSNNPQVNQPVAVAAPAMAPMHVVQPMQQGPYVVQGAYPASQPQGAYPMNQPQGAYPMNQPQGAYPMNQPQGAYPMNQQQGPGPMLADAKPPV